jgi:hypothetical protein
MSVFDGSFFVSCQLTGHGSQGQARLSAKARPCPPKDI